MTRPILLALLLATLAPLTGCAAMAHTQGAIWARTAPAVAVGRCQRMFQGRDAELGACLRGVDEGLKDD